MHVFGLFILSINDSGFTDKKKYENEEEKKIRVSYLLEKQNNQLKKIIFIEQK